MKAFKIDPKTGIYLDDITCDEFVENHQIYYENHPSRGVNKGALCKYYELYSTCKETDNIFFLNEVGGVMNERKYPRKAIFDLISYEYKSYWKDKLCMNRNETYVPNVAWGDLVLFKRIHCMGVDYYKLPIGSLNMFERKLKIEAMFS